MRRCDGSYRAEKRTVGSRPIYVVKQPVQLPKKLPFNPYEWPKVGGGEGRSNVQLWVHAAISCLTGAATYAKSLPTNVWLALAVPGSTNA